MKLISKGVARSFSLFFFLLLFHSCWCYSQRGKCRILSLELRNENNQSARALVCAVVTCTLKGNIFLYERVLVCVCTCIQYVVYFYSASIHISMYVKVSVCDVSVGSREAESIPVSEAVV